MSKSVSIVMTAYNRAKLLENSLVTIERQKYSPLEVIVVEDGDDGGATKAVCEKHGVVYIQRKERPGIRYSNPAIPNNIGLRAARNEIIVLQNAECMHEGNLIKRLASLVEPKLAVFASVQALNEDGSLNMWYTHPTKNARPYFFCGAMLTEHFHYLRGFDEDFVLYGYDDDNFADRLKLYGVNFLWDDQAIAKHQWHKSSYDANERTNQGMYLVKKKLLDAGILPLKANLGHQWGTE